MIRTSATSQQYSGSTCNGGNVRQSNQNSDRRPSETINRVESPTSAQRLEHARTEWQKLFKSKGSTGLITVNRDIAMTGENLRTNNIWGDIERKVGEYNTSICSKR